MQKSRIIPYGDNICRDFCSWTRGSQQFSGIPSNTTDYMKNNSGEKILNFDVKRFRTYLPSEREVQLGDDCLIADICCDDTNSFLKYPCRVGCCLAIFCIKGGLSLDINLSSYTLEEGQVLAVVPGYILKIADLLLPEEGHSRFVVVAISKEFMSSVRMDFNRLFNESMRLLDSPILSFSGQEQKTALKYFSLASDIITGDLSNKKEIVSSLVTSFCYLLGSVWNRIITDAGRSGPQRQSPRSKIIFEQFLKLVTEYHTAERNMAFYAEKLCLTPKYLSKLVKQVSGRSAPDWIDSFVILEAKNMLKYSDCTIKEIVYKLNFPNQSVFYKFFKSHTGMTPSGYRNS